MGQPDYNPTWWETVKTELRGNEQAYHAFIDNFVVIAAGSTEVKVGMEKNISTFDDIFSVSTEALALLFVYNSFDYWTAESTTNPDGSRNAKPTKSLRKYTAKSKAAVRNQGWGCGIPGDGIDTYNRWYHAVEADRLCHPDFGMGYRDHILAQRAQVVRKVVALPAPTPLVQIAGIRKRRWDAVVGQSASV